MPFRLLVIIPCSWVKKNGGTDRNWTGVRGFADRCVTTPPRCQKICVVTRDYYTLSGRKDWNIWENPLLLCSSHLSMWALGSVRTEVITTRHLSSVGRATAWRAVRRWFKSSRCHQKFPFSNRNMYIQAGVAQLIERFLAKEEAPGLSPGTRTILKALGESRVLLVWCLIVICRLDLYNNETWTKIFHQP